MKHQSLFVLGRQPAIGRAELESLFGASHVEPIGEQAMASDVPLDKIIFARLGGSTRLAQPVATIPAASWPGLLRAVQSELPKLLRHLPEGKIKLGLSAFGFGDVQPRQLLAAGLELKKACKRAGRPSVRLVPNTAAELNTAQVLHNQLTGDLGIELLLIKHGAQTYLAQTKAIQDINAYAARDQNRPKRDSRVGMLPPKLAQIIVNLAAGDTAPHQSALLLDPFCGTGVVLQEAALMGFAIYGTDLEPRMVDYTDQNLRWLQQTFANTITSQNADGSYYKLEVGDATTHQWQPAPQIIACETYLGRPLSQWPNPNTLQEIIGTCNAIVENFLKNIGPQLAANTRLCLAVPAWRAPNGRLHHLPLLDRLDKIGYNQVRFEHAKTDDLVYFRPDQLVARKLLVMIKK